MIKRSEKAEECHREEISPIGGLVKKLSPKDTNNPTGISSGPSPIPILLDSENNIDAGLLEKTEEEINKTHLDESGSSTKKSYKSPSINLKPAELSKDGKGIEEGKIEGISDKLNVLLSRETPLKKKLNLIEDEEAAKMDNEVNDLEAVEGKYKGVEG
ncbi:hypothetical protein L2E82_48302 [Cichorium intybus]|uniref:Uncharacterized protein n=1 Tax=Cichorium intybus TaxID=13427 RepID=A0ACB8YX58_CICIN|nr:hypothetical protein L2E82_48302 [Cichorium intybus]